MILIRLLMQTVVLALGQILANKVRSLLTTLGIVIGVAAVVATVAAIDGLRGFVLDEFETVGTSKVYIDGDLPQSWRGRISWRDTQLQPDEIEAIVEHAPSVTAINPHWRASARVDYENIVVDSAPVVGIRPAWHDVENRQVTMGRPFNMIDEEQRRYVILINDLAIEEFNLPTSPVGEFLLVGGRRFLIVGVVETLDLAGIFGGGNSRAEFFVPFSTAVTLNPNGWITYATATMRSPEAAEETRAEIDFILRSVRGLDPDDDPTFEIQMPQEYLEQFESLSAGLVAGATG
ncbi:MAG: ABC transporter permease, partial [Phycisphaerales bacterium]|nr:ABC transporter permease [Phycisphaerales bacterium]